MHLKNSNFHTIYGSAKTIGCRRTGKTDRQHFTIARCHYRTYPWAEMLEGTPQMLITSLDFSSYVGRIAVGRVHRGVLREGMDHEPETRWHNKNAVLKNSIHLPDWDVQNHRSKIGWYLCTGGYRRFWNRRFSLRFTKSWATYSYYCHRQTNHEHGFTINTSPFFGKRKICNFRHIHDRLVKRAWQNLALRVEKILIRIFGMSTDVECFTCRYLSKQCVAKATKELQVGQPQVIFQGNRRKTLRTNRTINN